MYFIRDIRNGIYLDSGTVDLGIIDPPFSISFNGQSSMYNRKKENVSKNYTEWDVKDCSKVSNEFWRILKPNGSVWVIMGWNALSYWNIAFLDSGFSQIGHIIWKYQFGVYTKKKPVTSHYHLLVFVKDLKNYTWNQQGYDEDVWIINKPYQRGGLKYPNKIPDKIIEEIIKRSSNEGDTIYDAFVGSGTTVKVAQRMNRRGIGSDIQDNSEFWK